MEIIKVSLQKADKVLKDVVYYSEIGLDDELIKESKIKFIACLDELFSLEQEREEAFGQLVLVLKKVVLSTNRIDSKKCDRLSEIFSLLNTEDLKENDVRWANSQLRLAGFRF